MSPQPDALPQHLAVYDYGMGGIWVLIAAQTPQAITDRYPGLRVATVGDPSWITPEKYDEIVSQWIPPQMHFDLAHPTGWLLDSDAALSKPPEPPS